MKKVFADTNIFRHAAEVKILNRLYITEGAINRKNKTEEECKISFMTTQSKKPNIPDSLKPEVAAIEQLSDISKSGLFQFFYSHEVNLELSFQPLVDIPPGRLYGANCKLVHSPILKVDKADFDPNSKETYPLKIYPSSRIETNNFQYDTETDHLKLEELTRDLLFKIPINSFKDILGFKASITSIKGHTGFEPNASRLFYPLLSQLENAKYTSILKKLRADSLSQKKKPNSYLDALHIWSAEESNCDIFLTLDKRITNYYKHSSLKALKPSSLIKELNIKP